MLCITQSKNIKKVRRKLELCVAPCFMVNHIKIQYEM